MVATVSLGLEVKHLSALDRLTDVTASATASQAIASASDEGRCYEIGRCEKMVERAVRALPLLMRPVDSLVELVLGLRAVRKVGRPAVGANPVEVANLPVGMRAVSEERERNDLVQVPGAEAALGRRIWQADVRVPGAARDSFQDAPTMPAHATETAHSVGLANARYGPPAFGVGGHYFSLVQFVPNT